MRVLILHGLQGKAGVNWSQWLSDELASNGHDVIMPTLPDSDNPNRHVWLSEIQGLLSGMDPSDLTIVAHSLGVSSALDHIQTLDSPLHKFVSAAGFLIPSGAGLNETYMQESEYDFEAIRANVTNSAVLYGDDDPGVAQEALQEVADELGVVPTVIPGGGHLDEAAGFGAFPELLQEVLA